MSVCLILDAGLKSVPSPYIRGYSSTEPWIMNWAMNSGVFTDKSSDYHKWTEEKNELNKKRECQCTSYLSLNKAIIFWKLLSDKGGKSICRFDKAHGTQGAII